MERFNSSLPRYSRILITAARAYIVGVLVYSIVTGLFLSGLLAYQNHSQANLAAAT